MCRIAGYIHPQVQTYDKKTVLAAMRDSLCHGGPDDAGMYIDDTACVAHRRLSIIGLGKEGHQPMQWRNWVMSYNGEVYNYQEVRDTLETEGVVCNTNTDTEVVLKSIVHWGWDALSHFRGMFAFALWHTQEKKLYLCRDRMGVKPLYYYWDGTLFMFASELKAFHQHPYFKKAIDHDSVGCFLQRGYIPAPYSIFKNVWKVEPGSVLLFSEQDKEIKTWKYWDAEKIYTNIVHTKRSEEEWIQMAETELQSAFSLRMVSDVPVGIFLSGGIDSSLVAALLQKESTQQLKTWTIGFGDTALNEAPHARKVAEHLQTDHTEYICTKNEFEKILPQFSDIYDEPFGDASGIPTFLLSSVVRKEMKVCLSADGGDELFGGYTKYRYAAQVFPQFQRLPLILRKGMARVLSGIHPLQAERIRIYYGNRGATNFANKFYKFKNVIYKESLFDFFKASGNYMTTQEIQALGHFSVPHPHIHTQARPEFLYSYLGLLDIQSYLEGDILSKVDRASMAVGLEARDPFLDHKLVEFALSVPDQLKVRNKAQKYILRQILYKHIPRKLLDRPKQGFAIPVRRWLQEILYDELVEIPQDSGFIITFGFRKHALAEMISDFLTGKKYVNEYPVWFVYVLWRWFGRWM